MDFLLDDKKVFWICGVILSICIFIYLLPSKKETIINLKQIPATGIIGYEPKYFNKEIYDLPNAKMSPYMLYGGNEPFLDYYNNNLQLGYERLKPTIELIPKTIPVQVYSTM